MLRAFTVGFEKALQSCLLLFAAFPGCQFEGPCYDCLLRGDKVLDTEEFAQHNIPELNSCITYIALFCHKRPLQ